ncbi:hypothetical protein [Sodalis sp. RH16]|uniref:hypothetical protein n=1 Tax=unclassified Sodalis (in: enterobacteria) TaxID=2636512 RepID=UPI0039B4AF8E
MNNFVTGAAGFTESAIVRNIINDPQDPVLVAFCLANAENDESLAEVSQNALNQFELLNICDRAAWYGFLNHINLLLLCAWRLKSCRSFN